MESFYANLMNIWLDVWSYLAVWHYMNDSELGFLAGLVLSLGLLAWLMMAYKNANSLRRMAKASAIFAVGLFLLALVVSVLYERGIEIMEWRITLNFMYDFMLITSVSAAAFFILMLVLGAIHFLLFSGNMVKIMLNKR